MKYVVTCFFLCFSLFLHSQDYYIKSQTALANQNQSLHIETLSDGSYIVAGFYGSLPDSSKLFIKRYNPCGTEIWAKTITDAAKPLDLVEMNIDSNQNIVLVGRRDKYNVNPVPFIIKLDVAGNLIYSKLLNSSLGYNSLIYSCSISPNGDYNLYGIHRHTTSPPNNERYYIARLSANGTLKWAKTLSPFAYVWGRALATNDGGILGMFGGGSTIFKLDSLGNKEWAKNYNYLGDLITPVETDSGYVFARYFIGAIDRGSLFSIRHNGSVQWATEAFFNFFPFRGITRRNGNVLFPGNNHFNSNSAVFLEVDPKNGSIQNFQELTNSSGYYATDLSENNKQEILLAGPDNRGVVPQLIVGKLNDTLSTLSCVQDTLPGPSDPGNTVFQSNDPLTVSTNTDLITTNFQVVIRSLALSNNVSECSFTKARGAYSLGADTTLCRGQSIQLGNANSDYDAYLWSNGSTNKTIALNQSGTYWLQVVAACDTLRDSINVQYLPGILFSIGPDTVVCGDSLVLGQGLNPAFNYVWSTGDSTRSITIRTSGIYWVENSNKCHTTRDSIAVFFQAAIAPIDLGKDTILCPNESIVLGDVNSPYETFEWSDGSQNKLLQVSTAGVYWLKASDKCSTSRDTITIDYHPDVQLNIGEDTSICIGDSISLENSSALNNYTWSTGDTTTAIAVSSPGVYWLATQTLCGIRKDSIVISTVDSLVQPQLMNDTMLCAGSMVQLISNGLKNYLWSDGSTNPTMLANDSGWYWVQTSNACDTLRDSVHIAYFPSITVDFSISSNEAYTGDSILFLNKTLKSSTATWEFGNGDSLIGDTVQYSYNKVGVYNGSLTLQSTFNCKVSESFQIRIIPSNFHIPTVFTPNSDGINDFFFPVGKDVVNYSIDIYNNWGLKIYSSAQGPWDGFGASGKQLEPGRYIYIMYVEFNNGDTKKFGGSINLIR